jgi:hypothetical protein
VSDADEYGPGGFYADGPNTEDTTRSEQLPLLDEPQEIRDLIREPPAHRVDWVAGALTAWAFPDSKPTKQQKGWLREEARRALREADRCARLP